MTINEAIKYVEWLKELKQQLREQTSEDAISRQAVLDIDFKRIILTTAKPAETIEQKVKSLPPVNPQPKTDVLDKIRAEIEAIIGEKGMDDYDFCSGLICAKNIINKYKESEE